MAFYKVTKKQEGGGGGIANILKGVAEPTSSIGDNGQLYLKYIDIANTYSLREYIEVGNTAGPYINTGLTTSSNDAKLTTEAEVIYSYTDRPDHNTWMFGAFSGYGIILGYQNGQTEGYVGSGGKLLDYDTNVHTVEFKDGGLYADDALKQTGNWTQIPNNTPIYIFGRGGDNRVIKNTRIYRCKIWQNGTLLRDLIPVQRKSDDAIGMLDLANNIFYDNDGTGSFTCGGTSDISSPIFKSYAKVNGQWQNLIGTNIDEIQSGGSSDVYTIEQGDTLTATDAAPVNTENDKLYMFFTGNHSGSFTNANVLVGSTSYFEIISGIGIASAIIQATSNTMTYDGAYSGDYFAVEIDILKNDIEDLGAYCIDRASSWTSGASISANIGDYYLIADTVNNESGTIIGADTLVEETLTHPVQPLNVKIRIIKATSTTISLSSGNNLYYRRFGLFKEI